MTGATSDFGMQLDSLADIISFGVAPAVLIYSWGFEDLGNFARFSAFLFLICGAMRLARFNIQTVEMKHFAGMPIPAGAGMIAAIVHFFGSPPESMISKSLLVGMTYLLALLMISSIRFFSFKRLHLSKGKSHLYVLGMAVIIAGVVFYSEIVLLINCLLLCPERTGRETGTRDAACLWTVCIESGWGCLISGGHRHLPSPHLIIQKVKMMNPMKSVALFFALIINFPFIFCLAENVPGTQLSSPSENFIMHTVMFSLKTPPDSEETAKFLRDGKKILSSIPGVAEFKVFRQVSEKNDFQYGFSMVFADRTAFESYIKHPLHAGFVSERWEKEVSSFLEADYIACPLN